MRLKQIWFIDKYINLISVCKTHSVGHTCVLTVYLLKKVLGITVWGKYTLVKFRFSGKVQGYYPVFVIVK